MTSGLWDKDNLSFVRHCFDQGKPRLFVLQGLNIDRLSILGGRHGFPAVRQANLHGQRIVKDGRIHLAGQGKGDSSRRRFVDMERRSIAFLPVERDVVQIADPDFVAVRGDPIENPSLGLVFRGIPFLSLIDPMDER